MGGGGGVRGGGGEKKGGGGGGGGIVFANESSFVVQQQTDCVAPKLAWLDSISLPSPSLHTHTHTYTQTHTPPISIPDLICLSSVAINVIERVEGLNWIAKIEEWLYNDLLQGFFISRLLLSGVISSLPITWATSYLVA